MIDVNGTDGAQINWNTNAVRKANIYNDATNLIWYNYVTTSEFMRIDLTNNRLGILTATPAYKLDVYGDIGITQTGGAGYLAIVAQSSNPSAPSATGLRLTSASDGHLLWVLKNGSDTYARKIDGVLSANRTFTLSDSDQTLASQTGIYFGRYANTYYEVPIDATATLSSASWTANRVHAMPFPLCNMNTISSIQIEVTTLVAASTCEIGIYEDDGTGYPGTLLASGQVDCSSTGFKTVAVSLSNLLGKKQVWVAFKPSSNSIGFRYARAIPLVPRGTGTTPGAGYYYAGAAGGLPTPLAAGATKFLSTTYGSVLMGLKM
jgi:hypothetical protein